MSENSVPPSLQTREQAVSIIIHLPPLQIALCPRQAKSDCWGEHSSQRVLGIPDAPVGLRELSMGKIYLKKAACVCE